MEKFKSKRKFYHARIDGDTDEQGIADAFASHFESVYSGHDSPQHVKLKDDFYYDQHISDDISDHYLSQHDMMSIASMIMVGKASAGVIRPEHFLQGSSGLMGHFITLFD